MRVNRLIYAILVIVTTFAVFPSRGQDPLDQAKKALEKARQAQKDRLEQQKQKQQQKQKGAQAAAQAAAQTAAAPPAQTLEAKVGEQLMGPMSQKLVMSEDGNHVALETAKGSRVVVLVDGVEGPVFDEIPRGVGASNNQVYLSPSGGRSAYVGRRGADYIAVVDGKEAEKVYSTATNLLGPGWAFFFNRDGSRLAYAVANDTGSLSMVVDGVKGERFAGFDLTQTALKGKRLVYVAQTADKKWHAVVDNKTGPAYDAIQSMMMTPDGAHYAFIGTRNAVRTAVLDGVDGKSSPSITDLEMAPDGRIAYLAAPPGPQVGPGGNPPHLIVGGLDVPSASPFSHPIPTGQTPLRYVAFSPDGKRFAYIQRSAATSNVTVMVNGKAMGLEYATAADLMFSPEGSRFAYIGGSATTGSFPVVDGKELDGYNVITDFQFSPDGKRYAFRGYRSTGAPGTTGIWAVVEGQEPKKYIGLAMWSMVFSPDGKHFSYSAQTTVANFQPVIDGEMKPGYKGTFVVINRSNTPISFPEFAYSPDSNRLAYVGQNTAGVGKAAVFLDGVPYEGISASFAFPSFTSNSKHFAWIQYTGKGWIPTVDGKIGPTYEGLLETNLGGCRFVDDHTFRFYGLKGGQIFRVTLDLGN